MDSRKSANLDARCSYVNYGQGKIWYVTNKMSVWNEKKMMWQHSWGLYAPFWPELLPQEVGKKAHRAHIVCAGAWLTQTPLTAKTGLRLNWFTHPSVLFQILWNGSRKGVQCLDRTLWRQLTENSLLQIRQRHIPLLMTRGSLDSVLCCNRGEGDSLI